MKKSPYKHNYLKELWLNRPWVYIPEVVSVMKKYPLKKNANWKIWIKNCLRLNWQVCYKLDRIPTAPRGCKQTLIQKILIQNLRKCINDKYD